jgi:hypothetical protein
MKEGMKGIRKERRKLTGDDLRWLVQSGWEEGVRERKEPRIFALG